MSLKKIFFYLFNIYLILANPSLASMPLIRAKNTAPIELTYLLQSLQEAMYNSKSNSEERQKEYQILLQKVEELDLAMQLLKPEEVAILVRSELTSFFLNYYKNTNSRASENIQSILSQLKKQVSETNNNERFHTFSKWLALGIQADLEELAKTPQKSNAYTNSTYQWAEKIIANSKIDFNLYLIQPMRAALDNLIAVLRTYSLMTQTTHPTKIPGKFIYFELSNEQSITPPAETPKLNAENNIDEVVKKLVPKNNTKKTPQKEWTPGDKTAVEGIQLTPQDLPRPSDDW